VLFVVSVKKTGPVSACTGSTGQGLSPQFAGLFKTGFFLSINLIHN
jgi:hypothetical protein